MAEEKIEDNALMAQMRNMVDKTIQRNVKGLDFIRAGKAEVGTTPKDLIYDQGTLKLYHYRPVADEIYRIPVIIVMATTNKGFLFDLAPGQSMVEFLIQRGHDVYMIDWDPPIAQERGLGLKDYTHEFLPTCVNKVMEDSGESNVNIIGYCMGGVLSLIYASTHTDGPLSNLVCLTTPVNWHEMGLFSLWSDERYLDVDKLVDTLGVIPADFIANSFEMLRPASRTAGRLRVWEQMWNDDFVKSYRAFERWGNETLPLAGEYYRDTTRELMWGNKLHTGELVVNGQEAKLENIKIPVMHAIAEHDHIAPYAATKPLLELVSSEDKFELELKGGHVSLIAGPNAVRRMWPQVDTWLGERSV
jgi:polyhydroxyalkanoate synthase